MFNTLFFDLDGTLYSTSTGLWEAIRVRMENYVHLNLRLEMDEVRRLCRHYYETYGTTLRGLQMHYDIDSDAYLAYVHDLPLDEYLEPDPALYTLLTSLPQDRWVFTNADDQHAHRVLAALEITDCFKGIIDVRSVDFQTKPDPFAYRQALRIAGESDPGQCALFDDTPHNLATAREMGIFTVIVGSNHHSHVADRRIANLHELQGSLPELWDATQAQSGSPDLA